MTDLTPSAGQNALAASDAPELLGGELLRLLLDDLVPRAATALVLGRCPDEALDLLRERVDEVTCVDVLPAGATADVVVALEGLGSQRAGTAAAWRPELGLAAAATAPGGTLLAWVRNPQPWVAGTADTTAEGVADSTAPTSAFQLADELRQVGLPVTTTHCVLGRAADPMTVLSGQVALRARPGGLADLAAGRALAEVAHASSATPDQARDLRRLVSAGLVSQAASGWLVCAGAHGRDLYLRLDDRTLWADRDEAGTAWRLGPAASGGLEEHTTLPALPSVETVLVRHIVAGDDAAFREEARALGAWVRAELPGTRAQIRLDELVREGDRYHPMLPGQVITVDGDRDPDGPWLAMRDAWRRFESRVSCLGLPTTWFDWSRGEDHVHLWLCLSDFAAVPVAAQPLAPAADETLTEAASGTAVGLVGSTGDGALGSGPAGSGTDVLTVAEQRLLRDHLEVTEHALERQQRQLRTREKLVRELRAATLAAQLEEQRAQAEVRRIRSSTTFKVARAMRRAADLRRPKESLVALLDAADRAVQQARRRRYRR